MVTPSDTSKAESRPALPSLHALWSLSWRLCILLVFFLGAFGFSILGWWWAVRNGKVANRDDQLSLFDFVPRREPTPLPDAVRMLAERHCAAVVVPGKPVRHATGARRAGYASMSCSEHSASVRADRHRPGLIVNRAQIPDRWAVPRMARLSFSTAT